MNKRIQALAQVRMTLVLAEKSDIIDEYGNLRDGKMYFVRSNTTGRVDDVPYYISANMDKKELSDRFKAKMIYVPRHLFDDVHVTQEILKIELVTKLITNEQYQQEAAEAV